MELNRLNLVFPILAVALILSLFGCGGADSNPTSIPVTPQSLPQTVAPTPIPTPTRTPTPTITPPGPSEGLFGSRWGTEGTGDGEFSNPEGVAVASNGSVYVADSANSRIQKFSVATPTPIATVVPATPTPIATVVPATPTPIVPTPTATPVVVRPNVAGYLLKINGSYVRPGHVSIAIDNGYIMVDPMTGKDGSYPKRTEVTLGYYPDNATDVVSWSGVDTGEGSIAQVFLDKDREVIATIGP